MSQKKRVRGRVLSDSGWQKLQNALQKRFYGQYTKEQLTELTQTNQANKTLSYDTVCKIVGREEGVDKSSIDAFFSALGLKLESSDHTPVVQASPSESDLNFIGREGAVADLNDFVDQGAKIIVIQGEGGIGKTTLAWHFLKTQGFDKVLELWMAKETQNIASVEGVIEEWLRRYFDEEPGREFDVTKERLRQKLRDPKQRIGVLIDNLEPALDDKGKFIETRRLYVELLRVLADPDAKSVTLITSRACLREAAVTVKDYRLQGLDEAAWRKFFDNRKLQTDTPALSAMHQAYGGNAKAMEILASAIEKDFSGNVAAYWQANNGDLLIERDLEDLVTSQFNCLQELDANAYKLLCRLGCYRYQDVPTVPLKGVCCLLWDVPEARQQRVVKALQERSLVEVCDGEYKLHPVIRAEAIARLRASEDWERSNRTAAECWTESVTTIETVKDALKAFEPYHHYVSINSFEQAAEVIVKKRINKWGGSDYLGKSFYRLGLLKQTISSILVLLKDLNSESTLTGIYNILGDLYWLTGKLKRAIDCHRKSRKLAIKSGLKHLQILALFNNGLCQIDLMEIEEAIKIFTEVSLISENTEFYAEAVCAWCCLAFLNSHLGFRDEAFILTEKSYKEITKHQGFGSWARGYNLLFLGMAYKNLEKSKNSFEMYNQAIAYAQKIYYPQVHAKALYGLAQLYREQGEFQTALSHHSKAIEILDKIGAKCDLAEAYYQLALTYQKTGEAEQSQANFQEAIQLFEQMEAPKQVEKVKRAMKSLEN